MVTDWELGIVMLCCPVTATVDSMFTVVCSATGRPVAGSAQNVPVIVPLPSTKKLLPIMVPLPVIAVFPLYEIFRHSRPWRASFASAVYSSVEVEIIFPPIDSVVSGLVDVHVSPILIGLGG